MVSETFVENSEASPVLRTSEKTLPELSKALIKVTTAINAKRIKTNFRI
jgi:hypothetical protein